MRSAEKNVVRKKGKKKTGIIIAVLVLVLALVVAGVIIFTKEEKEPPKPTNPLTGEIITEALPARPVIVSTDNAPGARPQSGISKADMVYEFPAEGSIPRLQPIYYSQLPERAAPVRSARNAFVDLAREYKGIFVAFGASPQAKAYLSQDVVPFVNSFVSGHESDASEFWRDTKARGAGVHNMYTNVAEIYANGEAKGWLEKQKVRSFPRYTGQELEEEFVGIPAASTISLSYVSEDIRYEFDTSEESTGLYTRYVDGKVAVDMENDEALTTSNIIIQFAEIGMLDNKRLDIDMTSGGSCIIFTKGMVFEGLWSRADLDSPTRFYTVEKNKDGEDVKKQIKLSVGKTWVQVVDKEAKVNY